MTVLGQVSQVLRRPGTEAAQLMRKPSRRFDFIALLRLRHQCEQLAHGGVEEGLGPSQLRCLASQYVLARAGRMEDNRAGQQVRCQSQLGGAQHLRVDAASRRGLARDHLANRCHGLLKGPRIPATSQTGTSCAWAPGPCIRIPNSRDRSHTDHGPAVVHLMAWLTVIIRLRRHVRIPHGGHRRDVIAVLLQELDVKVCSNGVHERGDLMKETVLVW
jgi:hypothetical protein